MNQEYNPNTHPSGAAVRPTAGGATASMICGIIGLLFCPLALVAVIMGHSAQGKIKRANGALAGEGQALTGVITGYIGMVLWALMAIPIMAAILVPAVSKTVSDAKLTEMKSNGKNMYVATFADAIDGNAVGYPSNGDYTSSTDYFKAMMGDNPKGVKVLPVTPDYFGGPHVPAATSIAGFSADNNGWNVVEGLSESSDVGIPFLISSNVKASSLSELSGRVGDNIDPAATGPMRTKVVVAYTGGGATVLRAEDSWENFGWPDLKILPP